MDKESKKSLLKKGDYIASTTRSGDDLHFILGVCEGACGDKVRVKGYEIEPKSDFYSLMKLKSSLLGGFEKITLGEAIFDELDYSEFNEIINIGSGIKIIGKDEYKYIEEWLLLGLPKIFSKSYDKKELKPKLEEKLKQAKGRKIRDMLSHIIKDNY